MSRLALLALLWLPVPTANAHPLGNNTVNRQATLHVSKDAVTLDYLVDNAEIPTLVQTQDADADGDGITTPDEWDAFAKRWAEESASHIAIALDGRPAALTPGSVQWKLAPGAADLFTLRLSAHYRVAATAAPVTLSYADSNHANESGWKEVWVHAEPGIVVKGGAATTDRSEGLTDFAGSAHGLLDETSARIELALAPPASSAKRDASPAATPSRQSRAPAPASVSSVRTSPPQRASEPAAPPSRAATPAASEARAPATAPSSERWQQRAWSFFRLGVHHIATGWDHLVFLIGLLLLRQQLGQMVKVITAFTLAHSVTLALAATGLVTPPPMLIEPAIALTIAYVGLINLVLRRARDSTLLAFAFGLVHGFGFAGALAATIAGHAGQTHDAWLLDLASFNLGIEAFQLLLVLCLVPLLAWAARRPWAAAAHRAASAAVLMAGLGWFLLRTIGGDA